MISPQTFARYAAMRVPRYTSYPTAPHFSAAIGPTEYLHWLTQLPPDDAVSVYVHVPFCNEMCWYCGCHTTVTRRRSPVDRYVGALLREIELVAGHVSARLGIGHLHLGGGSPTLLSPADVAALRSRLDRHFDVLDDAELAVEVDPRTLTPDLARAFGTAGINRASLGVQSFDPKVQEAINRIQSFEVTKDATEMLRAAGVRGINFDLIYGLPFQSVESCIDTVNQALRLSPDRFAVFGYAHVPSFKAHQRKIDQRALPSAAERAAQAEAISDALVRAGYELVGLDHFARPGDSLVRSAAAGTLHRNFQGYTADACPTLIGLGASSIGHLPQGYVQNATRIGDYAEHMAEGRLATVRGCLLDDGDRRRAAIIEQLMCNYRAELGSVAVSIDELEADGLIRRSGGSIEVVDEAKPLVRVVAAAFDAYLPSSAAQHVTAV